MLDYVILGVVQALTEFLPVSSSGHLILAREFFGITADHGLGIDALLQLATVSAVIIYFYKDIYASLWSPLKYTLAAATVPAIIAGVLLESSMETIFRDPILVAYTLLAGSLVMIAGEYYSRNYIAGREVKVTLVRGIVVGLFQCLALVPGMSRSGMTIAGGLMVGMSRVEAARFSFLLSIPILVGSGLKKLYDLNSEGFIATVGPELFVGALASFIIALGVIHILMKFISRTSLSWFALYRVALALIIILLV